MGDEPQLRRPFVARWQDLHKVRPGLGHGREPKADTRTQGFVKRQIVDGPEHDAVARDVGRHPAQPRRAGLFVIGAHEIMGDEVRLGRHPPPFDIGRRGIKRGFQRRQFLHHIVEFLGRAARPDRHMRLAVFQTENPGAGAIDQRHARVLGLKLGQNRHQPPGERGERGHHQLALHRAALPRQPRRKLGELIVCGLRDPRQILARLGRRVTPRVTLKQLHPQSRLERVDVADHRRMVDAQRLRGTRDRPVPHDFEGGAQPVPILHVASCAHVNTCGRRKHGMWREARSGFRGGPLPDPSRPTEDVALPPFAPRR